MNINGKDGWFFQNPRENKTHILTGKEIEQFFLLSKQEEGYIKEIKKNVEVIDENPPTKGSAVLLHEKAKELISGTLMKSSSGLDIITFSSRNHLFRGELGVNGNSVPSLNRKIKGKNEKERLLFRSIAEMRINQFKNFIQLLNIVKEWQKISDINYKALAQHYELDTNLLDLTNDVLTALFFATCIYDKSCNKYRPLNKEECDKIKYGVIFHIPYHMVEYNNDSILWDIVEKISFDCNQQINLRNGCIDGLISQIGVQPFMRCHYQSGYVLTMIEDKPLEKDWRFEKIFIKLTPELSKKVFHIMRDGEAVFPNEEIKEVLSTFNEIKNSIHFSENDLKYAYDSIGYSLYKNIEFFKMDLEKLSIDNKYINFQKNDVKYEIDKELLEKINAKYDIYNMLNSIDMKHCNIK